MVKRPTGRFDLDEPVAFRLAWASPTDLSFRIELLAMRSDAERTERLIALYSAMLPKLRRGATGQQHCRAATDTSCSRCGPMV